MIKYFGVICVIGLMISSCTSGKRENNQLTDEEKKDGWVLLFDGNSKNGWHLYNKGAIASIWLVKDGELFCNANNTNDSLEHGDLVSDNVYENFDLQFEWEIAEAGNSGVFINVVERPDIPTAWASGPEYQLLEKSNQDYAFRSKRSGSMFGFEPLKDSSETKPIGEWNQSRIKQVNGKVEFYLNGILTAQQDFKSPEWPAMVAQSGFKVFPEYGKQTRGHIALQAWLKGISFRDIKIKHL